MNTLAFGLSTGKRDTALAAALWFAQLEDGNQDPQQAEPPSPELVDVVMYEIA